MVARRLLFSVVWVAALLPLSLLSVPALPAPQGPPAITPVPFHQVRVDDPFWTPRLERNRRVTIPHNIAQCLATHRIDNFLVAGKKKDGGMVGYCFNDSDVYKVIEGAAHELRKQRDPDLEARIDEIVQAIQGAQEPDGYLYTARTIADPKNMPPGGAKRWSNIDHGHELYCAGHLYEAAVAYAEATGKDALLRVALQNAALVLATFGPGEGQNPFPPGHPEIELGLLALHRHTGEERFLRQAQWFLQARGVRTRDRHLFGEYSQDHRPILEQDAIVGHAVRACYLFAALTDVARLTGDGAALAASRRLWQDMASSQVYLTGGVGSQGSNEGFGSRFTLPNRSGYGETCASIANAMWSWRLFLATGDSAYCDMAEAVIFNAFHSGWSLSGDRFFYPNPLESAGAERQAWFGCACCPPNVDRFVPQLPGMAYATGKGSLWVTQFVGGSADLAIDGVPVRVTQRHGYPWLGDLRIGVEPEQPHEFALRVRVPGWVRAPLPGGLYRYGDDREPTRELRVNGEPVLASNDQGFAVIRRRWQKGDLVQFTVPMPVRRVVCDERVSANRGLVALMRGPMVYALEGLDQPSPAVRSLVLAGDAEVEAEWRPDLLGGVMTLSGRAVPTARTLAGGVAAGEAGPFTAIPYFAWANRGRTPMTVWLAASLAAARPAPAATLLRTAKVTASFGGDLGLLTDQHEPAASLDPDDAHLHWWPQKGSAQWLQAELPAQARVTGVQVYWFDDTGHGECRVPASWRVLCRQDGEWRPVAAADGFPVEKDGWCRATFAEVVTDGVRIEIQSQAGWAGGLYEWRLEGAAK